MDNVLVLAYLGDAIYEIKVRDYLVSLGICKLKELRDCSLLFVSAKAQASFLEKLKDYFTLDEENIIRRGRNAKPNSKPKNCDVLTYRYATAFEVLFGYLYVNKKYDRIDEIFNLIIKIGDVDVSLWKK